MGWKIFFSFLFILIVIGLLGIYWFVPFREVEFQPRDVNTNFSISGGDNPEMQFYPNMRYPESMISYKIYNCPLKKKNDMEQAFYTLSNTTMLKFYPVNFNEEISVTCESKERIEGGLFIAGEGGPTNITQTSLFNIITHGKILLIKESDCPRPNIAIHELLHALGFDHSDNPNNVLHNITNCDQTIGQDTINVIKKIYSTSSYSDLAIINASASIDGRYLNIEANLRNNGLAKSSQSEMLIYADDNLAKNLTLDEMQFGYGLKITLKNIWVSNAKIQTVKIQINSHSEELNKENNQITLRIKD